MERKEKVYLYISSPEYIPLTFGELCTMLDVPGTDIPELESILSELCFEGKIFLTKKKRYAPCSASGRCAGILRCNPRGFGFVCPENGEDILISREDMADAIDGDRVLAHITSRSKERRKGKIEKVLERTNTKITAVLDDNFGAVPDNSRIFAKIKLLDTGDAKPGDRVVAELCEYPRPGLIYASVLSVLGSGDKLSSLCDAIVFEHNIKTCFDPDTLLEADALPDEISEEDKIGREDFTAEMIFTIDGVDAKDFDDAVSLSVLPGGNYLLGVHIADVSHYVTEKSALDSEASSRGTSVYLADRVIPMLPEKLSNGLCSLLPGVDRLTLSVIMEVSPEGEVLEHRITKGVIHSKHRMTYSKVQQILDGEHFTEYADIEDTLIKMHSLSKILEKKRRNRGSINFDFPETKAILDNSGYPIEIAKIERCDAHKLIEEFMLLANETVAEFSFWADIPFIFRVHGEPSSDKAEAFRRFIAPFGLFIKGMEIHPKDLQRILDEVAGTPNENLIATYMLHSLMKAEYKTECLGHFGLAARYYCHFTSPIRRYPDLFIHRVLKAMIDGKDISAYKASAENAAKMSSETERNAELCERDVSDLMKTTYISNYIGAEFPAKISSATSFGIYAELENGIEGLIRLDAIPGDFYEYDELSGKVIGRRHRKSYTVGDEIKIEVIGADIRTRRIDFILSGTRNVPPKKHIRYKGRKKHGKF